MKENKDNERSQKVYKCPTSGCRFTTKHKTQFYRHKGKCAAPSTQKKRIRNMNC